MSGVFKDSHGFKGVLGGIGWFGFLLCVLLLIIWGVVACARWVNCWPINVASVLLAPNVWSRSV